MEQTGLKKVSWNQNKNIQGDGIWKQMRKIETVRKKKERKDNR